MEGECISQHASRALSDVADPAVVLEETHNAAPVGLVLVAGVTKLHRETVPPLKVVLQQTRIILKTK